MEHPPPYSPTERIPPQNPYPPQPLQEYPPQPGYPPQKQYGDPGYPPQSPGYVQQPAGFSSQTTTNTTVVVQQQPQVVTTVAPMVNDYMGLSIFVFLCCCWPIGICAIAKSCEARNRNVAGDYAGAVSSAQSARNLGYAALICGLIIIPLIIVLRVIVFTASASQ